jgi:hypothetical protein
VKLVGGVKRLAAGKVQHGGFLLGRKDR